MRQFVTFKIENQSFGIDIDAVREINQQVSITPVPQAGNFVRGLVNLRGQIVTIIDLGVRLGLPPRDLSNTNHNVILKTEEELAALGARQGGSSLKTCRDVAGLLVDEIGDVVEETEQMEPRPANVGSVESRFLQGVIKRQDELLLILSLEEVLGEVNVGKAGDREIQA